MRWPKVPYVDVISHSHDLHKGVTVNPQGNKPAAAVNRFYDEVSRTYETTEQYVARIRNDLEASKSLLDEKLGRGASIRLPGHMGFTMKQRLS